MEFTGKLTEPGIKLLNDKTLISNDKYEAYCLICGQQLLNQFKDTAICKTRLGLEEGTRSDRSLWDSEIKQFARVGRLGNGRGITSSEVEK